MLAHKLAVALQIGVGHLGVRLRLCQASLSFLYLLMRRGKPGFGIQYTRFRRVNLRARADLRNGDIEFGGLPGRGAVQKVGVGPFNRKLIVRGVDFNEHVAGANDLATFDVHLDDVPGDARTDRIDMPIDLGVVRILVVASLQPIQRSGGDEREKGHAGQYFEGRVALDPGACRGLCRNGFVVAFVVDGCVCHFISPRHEVNHTYDL